MEFEFSHKFHIIIYNFPHFSMQVKTLKNLLHQGIGFTAELSALQNAEYYKVLRCFQVLPSRRGSYLPVAE